MKKILVVGKNSYIGLSFKQYLENSDGDYAVDELETIGYDGAQHDFSGYDALVYVAGIAHIKETEENAHLYYEVNRDLAEAIAKKAKAEGVGHFVFLSSMSVYGMETGVITPDTVPNPKSHYGKSKWQAEQRLTALADDTFKLAIVRPPMVYGNNCKGNFQTVVKLVNKLPVFPKVNNRRSMIYIDNLSSFMKLCVDETKEGVFCPQNEEYVNTSVMAKAIADKKGKGLFLSRLMGLAVVVFRPFLGLLQKAFGTLIYQDMEQDNFSYCVVDQATSFKESV